MHDVQFSGMNSREEEDSLDNKDQFYLFSSPSFRLWEQALLRVAPTTQWDNIPAEQNAPGL